MPQGSEPPASASSAGIRFFQVNPCSRPPLAHAFAQQFSRVSVSSKKSRARGRYPARRAAAANARAEAATIRTGVPASDDLARKSEGIAKIKTDGPGETCHSLEEARFRFVLHIPDRERPEPQNRTKKGHAIGLEFEALDSRRRHSVHIGRKDEGFCRCEDL